MRNPREKWKNLDPEKESDGAAVSAAPCEVTWVYLPLENQQTRPHTNENRVKPPNVCLGLKDPFPG